MRNFQSRSMDAWTDADWTFLSLGSFVSYQYLLHYVATPKVACTALKWWFAELSAPEFNTYDSLRSYETDPSLTIHDTFHLGSPKTTGLKPADLRKIVVSDDFFRFALVRNPFTRLFSAWQSKILLREPIQADVFIGTDFYNQEVRSVEDIARNVESFLEYLHANQWPDITDPHWAPQSEVLRIDKLSYSQIAKLEEPESLWENLADRIGSNAFSNPAQHKCNESLLPYAAQFFTERSIQLVRKLYAADFMAFDYSLLPPSGKPGIERAGIDTALQAAAMIRGRNRRFMEVRRALDVSDTQATHFRLEVAQRDQTAAVLAGRLAEREHNFSILQNQLSESTGQLAQYNEAVSGLNAAVADGKHRIAEITDLLARTKQSAATLNNDLTERNNRISTLQKQVSEITAQLSHRDETIAGLHAALTDGQLQIAAMIRVREARSLRGRLKTLRQKTRPLRYFLMGKALPSTHTQHRDEGNELHPQKRKTRSELLKLLRKKSRPVRYWIMRKPLPRTELPRSPSLAAVPQIHAPTPETLTAPPPMISRDTKDYVKETQWMAIDTRIKAIAFYLPQFHPIHENDVWWGKGFTEWTNVSKAQPQFAGHYQPHLPAELGFYDLRVLDVQKRQIELARQYGIQGFCYYYYWFNGRKLLEHPLEQMLARPELDFPFCICWANESWSRCWDGLESDVLIQQRHSAEDDLAFIQEVTSLFTDSRYIRVGDRPLLVIYRPSLLPDPAATARRWRQYCRDCGVGEIVIAYTQSFDRIDPAAIGFDYAIEFSPNNIDTRIITSDIQPLNSNYAGTVYDYPNLVEKCRELPQPNYALFRSVCPGWDNEARKPGHGVTYAGATPALYRQWLKNACQYTSQNHPVGEQFVFINAWNEWAEGAHLEPDRRYGYAWLQATAEALQQFPAGQLPRKLVVVTHDCHPHGAQLNILNVCRHLTEQHGCTLVIIMLGEGDLEGQFAQCGEIHRWWQLSSQQRKTLLSELKSQSYFGAICNTVVSAEIARDLKRHGFKVLWLVHEMAGVIRQFGQAENLGITAKAVDRVVFASTIVRDSFLSLSEIPPDKVLIRAQGMYMPNEYLKDRHAVRQHVRKELGIPADAPLVLAAGFGDRRKGPDLFVQAGNAALAGNSDIHFVWVGDLHQDFGIIVKRLLRAAPSPEHFHFVPRTRDVSRYFAAADLYLLTSREDPFPSVVLEAFHAGLPVIGFSSAGGFSQIVTPRLGRLVPFEDTRAMGRAVVDSLADTAGRQYAAEAGPLLIKEHYDHKAYARDLAKELGCTFPAVSVVVPNYNYAHYLPQRLESILQQTYRPAEIIFLDDGSEDNSVEVARAILSCGDVPFRIIENRQNQGVFAQWLRGIDESASELIWIAEADDLCTPTLLARLVDGFRHPDVVLSYAQSKMIDDQGAILGNDYLQYTRDIDADKWQSAYLRPGHLEIMDSLIIKNTIPNASAVLFRKPTTAALRPVMQDLKHAGDWMFYLNLLQDGWICFVPEPLNHHRRHSQSVTLKARAINLFREVLRVQMFWLQKLPIDAHTQSMIEMVRQSTYQALSLHAGGYPDYRKHPDLADVLEPPCRHNGDNGSAHKSKIPALALMHTGT